MTIDWRLGIDYSDVTILQGTGLLFSWSGAIKHNLVEMMSEDSISSDCTHVGADISSGQVCWTDNLEDVMHMYEMVFLILLYM